MGQMNDNRAVQPLRLVQITDPHLGGDEAYIQSGINTYQSLNQVLTQIAASSQTNELVVATGDLSFNGLLGSYQLFESLLETHGLPFCWLPGNHDDFDTMEDIFQVPFRRCISAGKWNLLMVRSAEFNRVEGGISEKELAWLQRQLEQDADTPTLVFSHHPPLSVGSRWIDKQQIANGGEFLHLLSQYPNVKAVFSGHVHQESHSRPQSLPVYTTPSTCFQFLASSTDFAIANQPPGYRWIDLYDNGQFETGVKFLDHFTQVADQHCMGY